MENCIFSRQLSRNFHQTFSHQNMLRSREVGNFHEISNGFSLPKKCLWAVGKFCCARPLPEEGPKPGPSESKVGTAGG